MKDYFQVAQNKYNPLLSDLKPIVIRIFIDTKKSNVNFNDDNPYSISNALNVFTKKFSREYQCIGIINFNEVNFIFNNADILKNKFKKLETQSINSQFSQEIFYKLNTELNINGNLIYPKINVFNIFDNKIKSYVCHRQNQGFNNYLRYSISKYMKFSESYKKNKYEILEILNSIKPISKSKLEYIKNGFIYKEGYLIGFTDLDKTSKDIKNKYIQDSIVQISENTEIDDI